jgi:hypothetical protein
MKSDLFIIIPILMGDLEID